MSDNAKCAGVGCSIRESCLRFTRPAVDGQQWILGLHGFNTAWVGDGLLVEPARMSCRDHQPIPVEPHGGAQEEGDAC